MALRPSNEESAVMREDMLASEESEPLTAYRRIPQSIIANEVGEEESADVLAELAQISKFYEVYRNGCDFNAEGSNNDYQPANLHYKMAASLIDKEARFLFAETPTVNLKSRSRVSAVSQDDLDSLTELVNRVLESNFFAEQLLKAARDCFIGKRVAGLVNLNEVDGITLTFLPSTHFLYETRPSNPTVLTRFTAITVLNETYKLKNRRLFVKRYELDGRKVMLTEEVYDGTGTLLETPTPRRRTKLDRIPAIVFANDGLTGDARGVSEVRNISYYEKWYSRLSSADIDAQRKSMNPIKYSVDMDNRSTKNLSTGPGAYWDFGSDQNLTSPHPEVGMLEPKMNYSDALGETLNRLKTTGFEQVDMPNINLEAMNGTFTSGKAIKALYWPLIVRCEEKMKMWGPQLSNLMRIVIDGSYAYPACVVPKYVEELPSNAELAYEIDVLSHVPIPEDEVEKKNMDLAEVASQTMSKKSYMKKWYDLTDDEVQAELEQIALENQIINYSAMGSQGGFGSSPNGTVPSPDQSYNEPRSTKTDNDPTQSRDDNMPDGARMDDTRNASE